MRIERRNHARAKLRVPVFVLPAGTKSPVRTQTEDVSVDSFFCYTPHFFSPADRIQFVLFLPPAVGAQSHSGVCMQGEAEVVRVSIEGAPAGLGIACRLMSYRVLPDSDLLPAEELVANFVRSSHA